MKINNIFLKIFLIVISIGMSIKFITFALHLINGGNDIESIFAVAIILFNAFVLYETKFLTNFKFFKKK